MRLSYPLATGDGSGRAREKSNSARRIGQDRHWSCHVRSRHQLSGERRARSRRARDRRWRRAADISGVVPADFLRRRRPRCARAEAGRSSRHGAAKSLGGRDAALGLPVRRHHHHAGELARDARRTRFLLRGRRARRRWSTKTCRPRPRGACQAGCPRHERRRLCRMVQAQGARRAAARRRRCVVGDALHLRHHRAPEGRAAPPARRTRRSARACGAEHVSRAAKSRSA